MVVEDVADDPQDLAAAELIRATSIGERMLVLGDTARITAGQDRFEGLF